MTQQHKCRCEIVSEQRQVNEVRDIGPFVKTFLLKIHVASLKVMIHTSGRGHTAHSKSVTEAALFTKCP